MKKPKQNTPRRWLGIRRSSQAAVKFEAVVAAALDRIAESPEQFPTCDEEGFRYAILRRYPHSLIYRITAEAAQVVAIAHAHRRPGYWSGRH